MDENLSRIISSKCLHSFIAVGQTRSVVWVRQRAEAAR